MRETRFEQQSSKFWRFAKGSRGCARADIATGTGIFLAQLASKLPSTARLDGFDISPAQFPTSHPPNVFFHVDNAKEPFPAELHGCYDAVHLRLLADGMQNSDHPSVVRDAIDLLKSGGAIQWTECNHRLNMPPLVGKVGAATVGLRTVIERMLQAAESSLPPNMLRLREILAEEGLVDVEEDVVSSDRLAETRSASTEITIQVGEGVLKFAKTDEEELSKLGDDARKDVASGAYTRFDIHVVRGFKPV